jgi:glycosyltransferase involved in cell wall biosynthesis
MQKEEPFVSIVVPVKNNESTVKSCVSSLLNLSYNNYEIIIIDDGSTDRTRDILEEYQSNEKIKIIAIPGSGPSVARNLGMQHTSERSEYVAFTDGDCIVDKNWLTELLRPFIYDIDGIGDRERIAGVGGRQESPPDETSFGRYVMEFMKHIGFITDYMKVGSKIYAVEHNPTCNVLFRKRAIFEVGGFKAGLWPGEDVELDYRLRKRGYKLYFNPSAVVYHYRPNKLHKFVKMMFSYGRVQAILVKMYGVFRKIHIVPFIFIPLVILHFALLLRSTTFFIILVNCELLPILCYFIAQSKKMRSSIIFLFMFIITLFSWNIGFMRGLFSAKK